MSKRNTATCIRVILLLFVAALAACGRSPSDWPVSHDLAAGFMGAEVWSETRSIEFGTARGRRHLLAGWSEDLWDGRRKRSFVIGGGEPSSLWFELLEPRPVVIQLFARPVPQEAAAALDLSINGFPVQSLELASKPRRYRVPVQAGLLRSGHNELVLQAAGSSEDGAPVAIACYRMDFVFTEQGEPPMPLRIGDGDSLMLPYGTRVEYVVRLSARSALTIDRVRHLGPPGGSLSVVLEEDGQDPARFRLTPDSTGGVKHDLSADGLRIVRLGLQADHPEAAVDGQSGVILESPVLRAGKVDGAAEMATVADLPGLPEGGKPNILLYVVDTLRADHLGVYGYSQPVSPELDRFAAAATVFDNAVAQSSWTRASMASIFTGLWPLKHAANGRKDILDPEATTMAEILGELGYETVARVRNWNVFPVFGFRQGFEDFDRVREGKADRLTAMIEAWIDQRQDDRPFFLWLHTVDPHEPYRPPAVTREQFLQEDQPDWGLDKHPGFKRTARMSPEEKESVIRYLVALYDAEIAFNDRAFGDLMRVLEQRDLLDSTVIVFVSDHGEEFLDHGTWGHGRNLYAENLNVPLIVRFPDRGHGQRVPELVQHIDLLPTLLEYIGQPVPEHLEGRSFLPLLDRDSRVGRAETAPAFSFLHLDGAPTRSLVDGDWKLIQRLDAQGGITWQGLYHRGADPGETVNRLIENPIRAGFMAAMLDAKMAEGSLLKTEEAVLDEETTNALKALGYLQ